MIFLFTAFLSVQCQAERSRAFLPSYILPARCLTSSHEVSDWLAQHTQLSGERIESEQMAELFVNASAKTFAVMEIFSRNPCVARITAWETLVHAHVSALKNFRS